MIDYHVHTEHSEDAQGTLEEYARRAQEIGLTRICFTNHLELDEARRDNVIRLNGRILPVTSARLRVLCEQILDVRERFAGQGLDVRVGFEVGYYPGMQERLHDMIQGLPLDFLIGGIHCLDHVCIDSSREYGDYFPHHTAEELLRRYYETARDLAGSGLFDTFAHLDVYKKYGIGHYGDAIRSFPREMAAETFREMVRTGLALEINTAGMRRVNEFYPAEPLMELARAQGVKRVTVGSDAHRVADLGKDLDRAYAYAQRFGMTVVAFEERRLTSPEIQV